MKVFDILIIARPYIEKIMSVSVNPKDVELIDLYMDYMNLKNENNKLTYIEAVLCEKYGIGKTKYRSIIKQFSIDL